MKFLLTMGILLIGGRAPYGARGLKSRNYSISKIYSRTSRPVWGAWIEIKHQPSESPPLSESRPVWGAWIEIKFFQGQVMGLFVAPRMGRVD